jgi:hypothetical protein
MDEALNAIKRFQEINRALMTKRGVERVRFYLNRLTSGINVMGPPGRGGARARGKLMATRVCLLKLERAERDARTSDLRGRQDVRAVG